jgi:hypothetical protein
MRAKIVTSQWIDRIVAINTTLDEGVAKATCIRISVGVLRHGAILPPRCDHLIFSTSPEDISSPESLINALIMGLAFIGEHEFWTGITIKWLTGLSDNSG